jgi:ribosome biogenesis protein BRX1
MWVGSYPNGPSMRFSLDNIVSSSDMKLQGNALKSSRHVLSFDKTFSIDPVWKIAA